MIGHALVRIIGCDSLDQFGGVRVSRNNGSASRFSPTKRLFPVDKRDPVLLANSPVTRDAVLIENGPDVPAEIHSISRKRASYVRGKNNQRSNPHNTYAKLNGTNPVLGKLKHSQKPQSNSWKCSQSRETLHHSLGEESRRRVKKKDQKPSIFEVKTCSSEVNASACCGFPRTEHERTQDSIPAIPYFDDVRSRLVVVGLTAKSGVAL
jgi:hypothetical protein